MQRTKLYGGAFAAHNRNNPRTLIANWVPANANVLEVGPGDGVISRWLKQEKHCRTTGIEFVPQAAAAAQDAFEHLFVGSVEDEATLALVQPHAPFDAIIFADVLEHLIDPWRVLRTMRPLLSPTGRVMLSVPNIAHLYARFRLLMGRFDYTDGYLMDRTHLRWFTRRSAQELGTRSGYRVMDEHFVFKPHVIRLWPNLMAFQFVLNLAVESR